MNMLVIGPKFSDQLKLLSIFIILGKFYTKVVGNDNYIIKPFFLKNVFTYGLAECVSQILCLSFFFVWPGDADETHHTCPDCHYFRHKIFHHFYIIASWNLEFFGWAFSPY